MVFHVIRKGGTGNDTQTGKRPHITKNKRTHKKRTRGRRRSSPLSHRDDESPDTSGREGLFFLEQGRGGLSKAVLGDSLGGACPPH